MPLGSVNNSTLRDLVSEMAQAGFASGTIKGYAQVVKMVIASAIHDDGEPMYPRKWNHEFIDLPLVRAERTTCFTSEQVNRIVAANGPYHVLYALLAGSGMRIGEALGLEISDVSADGQTIRIRQSVWNGRVQTPKTLSSLREIDLHPSLAGLLLDYIGPRQSGFVFQTSRGTALQVSHVLCRGLHPVLGGLGEVKTGFHAFRRFRVTYLRKQGIPEDLLRFWIGHGDKTVTDGYSKVKHDAEFRRAVANSIPLGFELPAGKPALSAALVPNVPTQEFLPEAVNA